MNKEQFAQLLKGRNYSEEYRREISREEHLLAKENNLLVCFGESDDLLEFRGIIYDEIGVYDGGTAYIIKKKGDVIDAISENDLNEIQDIMDDKELEFNIPKIEISAEWCPENSKYSWVIDSFLPHAKFDIMEDGDFYCSGIVIEKSDIEKYFNKKKK